MSTGVLKPTPGRYPETTVKIDNYFTLVQSLSLSYLIVSFLQTLNMSFSQNHSQVITLLPTRLEKRNPPEGHFHILASLSICQRVDSHSLFLLPDPTDEPSTLLFKPDVSTVYQLPLTHSLTQRHSSSNAPVLSYIIRFSQSTGLFPSIHNVQ